MFKKITIFLLVTLITISTPLTALQAVTFNPSLILTDEELADANALNLDQIKNFLKNKGSYLTNYVEPTVRMYVYQIIYDNAQFYQINPKYLLTLLQKEQGLITETNPTQSQLDWATGYGCPDSGGCNEKYRGLANQIDWGAGGTRYYFNHPNEFRFQVGSTYEIDNQKVTIANDATRALYIYTPHLSGNQTLHRLWNEWFAPVYPDGSLLQNASDATLWLIQNNLRRKFASKSVFASRYSFSKLIIAKVEDLEKYEIGRPIQYANYSLLRIPTGTIYLLEDETLRPIANMETFRLLGFNPEELVKVTEEDLVGYGRGELISLKSSYPTGALLQDATTGGVYYVKDGIKYPIWAKNFLKLYFSDKKIIKVKSVELEKYETGLPVKLKDGELVKATDSPIVYIISNGLKRPLANAETFEGLGYKWKNIVIMPAKVLDLHDTGEIINIVE